MKKATFVTNICACGREYTDTAITENGEVIFPVPTKCIACIGNANEQIINRRDLGNMREAVYNAIARKSDFRLTIATTA